MLEKIIREKKLVLVCGSGGVGKTTVSAGLALKGALLGKKVVVLTIDPAKRLATSLGLEGLTNEPQRIKCRNNVEFHAMMLDTKRTFDQLVIKYSPSKDIEKRILGNKIYQHLSDMIAGSQEYMAMEKLYEIVSMDCYDLIVVDTPPTTHAIDFLEAPEKMVDAISHSMLHLLLKPAIFMGKSGLKLIEKGSRLLLKIFDRITGFAFLQEISEMLISFQDLLGGFKNRALEVRRILMDSGTSFLLVSACEEKSIMETIFFSEKLSRLKLPWAGIVANRVHPLYSIPQNTRDKHLEELRGLVGGETAEKMAQAFEHGLDSAKRDKKFEKALKDLLSDEQFLVSVPLFESDIHDMEGLYRLSENF